MKARTVTLEDQFGVTVKTVEEPELLCAPVSKNSEGISDPKNHLVCYEIETPSKTANPKFQPVRVRVDNQFGKQILTVEKSELLCVPSSKTVLGPAGDDDDHDDDGHDHDHGDDDHSSKKK